MKASVGSDAEVMTRDQVASWLQVAPRQVERLGVPCLDLSRKTKRYLRSDVLQWLAQRRTSPPRPDRS
jgi:hypothetical protein